MLPWLENSYFLFRSSKITKVLTRPELCPLFSMAAFEISNCFSAWLQQIRHMFFSLLTQMFWFWLARWSPPSKLKLLTCPAPLFPKKYCKQPLGALISESQEICWDLMLHSRVPVPERWKDIVAQPLGTSMYTEIFYFDLPRDDCEWPSLNQLKRTTYIVVLFSWRYKMCNVSWFEDGRSQSPLGICVCKSSTFSASTVVPPNSRLIGSKEKPGIRKFGN